jgi:hypothetical protein
MNGKAILSQKQAANVFKTLAACAGSIKKYSEQI